jgi:adhesin/invasin
MFTEATAGRIELTCSPNVIEADGISEAVCTAVVERSNGEPVANGTVVTFSTTAGTLTATSAQTTNGIATTSLRSTTTGTIATVTASSGSITVSDRVQFLDNPPTRVTLTARPRQIKADGREQSIITATVRRRDGSLAVDGTIVNCVTSDGTLSPTQLMTLDGNATTNLTSATFEARATVTCVSGTGIGTVTVNFIESSTGEVDIRVTANPQTIRVGGQTSTITIRVLNASGGGIANEDVFLSVSGVPNVTLVPTQATTNASGQVTATLTSGVTAGQAVVAADAGAVTGTATVTILPLPASDIVNFTVPNSIVEGGSGTVSLVVVDRFGNPVDGTQVSFSITCPGGGNGDACDRVTLSTSTALTVNGFASTLVQVANGSPEVQVQIRAAVGTISRTGSITVIRGPTPTPTNTPGPTSTPTITPTPGVTPTP